MKQPKVLKKRGEDEYDGQQLSSPVITSWNDYHRSVEFEAQPYVVSVGKPLVAAFILIISVDLLVCL